MIKWIFLAIVFYYFVKIIMFVWPILKFKKNIENQDKKINLRSKVSKMDILDAEFEDKP